ncbi:hypothetical protein SETIT_6G061900v2 [Setaria italica]|uniref:DUF4220 domain-containing protein n=1 Tax=Setaria italica TaxID=4555 RepID=K3YGB9_SETIT|nr:uncharacterized protein LOC101783679 [Setaria italica]RCV30038.1 hypothetical protein SETIT_6G061900v2 [Setaria italica]
MTMEQHYFAPAPAPSQKVRCPVSAILELIQRTAVIKPHVLRVNVLTLGNAILAGILVGIGTYGTRYRHRAFVRALFQGATTLFLPILSYVVSSASATVSTFRQSTPGYIGDPSEIAFNFGCDASKHLFIDLIWAGLVNIVGIITCTMVAATDREGRNIGLPMALLVQAIWSCYLVVSLRPQIEAFLEIPYMLLPTIFALFFAKMALRYYAFLKARRSVALGHNPPLIVGYIEQLHKGSRYCIPQTVEHCPPPLVVTGEHRHDVVKVPHGFFFKRLHHNQDDSMTTMSNYSGLVTVDKIWLSDNKILTSAPWLKDVCLSFSLFKLLRCRFAGYSVAEAGFQEAYSFFLHVLLKDKDHERVYGVITDELSFLHDYYYSSIPIHYSNFWLPMLNIFVSLLTIIYCLLLARLGIPEFITDMEYHSAQVHCWISCSAYGHNFNGYYDRWSVRFGNIAFDAVPVAIVVVVVVLAEAREIATYICSKWTKVGLISYVVNNHDKWQGSPSMQEWIGRVLRCRCKLMKHWDDKMNQCSVLVLHPRRSDPIVSLISRLLHLPDRKRNVKVPRVVKAAIVDALRSNNNNNGFLADPATFLRQSLEDRSGTFLWASDGEGIADIILMWHIATGILGVRRQHQQPPSGDMIVATHLSRYCAYLVAYVPELLPDYDKWSKGLYMAVKKDSMRALAGRAARPAAESEYDKLVSLLQERAENEVLRNGVKLAEKLEREGEEAAWRLLAGFWSQMILYIAPSENLNGHADAIARGGELITFVWALLMHAGIARRPATGERV